MKAFLDASFLVYLNTLAENQRDSLDDLFARLLGESLFTNMMVLDETLSISRRKYAFPYDVTLLFLRKLVLPRAEIVPIEEEDLGVMAKYLRTYNLKPSDAIHLATMEKTGVNRIVTEDEQFDNIKGISRIWFEAKL